MNNRLNRLKKWQALGRLKKGTMNKTEQAYYDHLKTDNTVLLVKFEALKLKLADNTSYTPDFLVMRGSGELECHEVKGWMTDDANVKIKVAAELFPFRFLLVRKGKGGQWDIKEI